MGLSLKWLRPAAYLDECQARTPSGDSSAKRDDFSLLNIGDIDGKSISGIGSYERLFRHVKGPLQNKSRIRAFLLASSHFLHWSKRLTAGCLRSLNRGRNFYEQVVIIGPSISDLESCLSPPWGTDQSSRREVR